MSAMKFNYYAAIEAAAKFVSDALKLHERLRLVHVNRFAFIKA
jgi:hypothetical protein